MWGLVLVIMIRSGAVKDMVQNHLLQVLSIVAMEEPKEEGSH